MNLRVHLKKLDWCLILTVILLCTIGLTEILSTTYHGQGLFFLKKQFVGLALGFTALIALSFIDYHIFRNYSSVLSILYLFGFAILVLVLFGGQIRGVRSWLRFGSFYFQPVEYIKIIIIFLLAKYFSWRHIEMFRLRHLFVSAFYVFLPAGLVLLQPDFGSFLILAITWIGMVIIAGIKLRHLLTVILVGLILVTVAWVGFLKDYQKQRILSFIDPELDPLGSSYNIHQSLIAIGAGGWLGKGLGHGTQSQLGFLPEDYSDFIFASFAEEWGFLGVVVLIILYSLIFYRLYKSACLAKNNFSSLVPAGIAVVFLAQIFINAGSNLGIIPITGVSLPFISYGGSNLIMNFIALGVLQSIVVRSKT